MWAVIFEVQPQAALEGAYLDTAATLLPTLQQIPGFVSVERFRSDSRPGRLLSLSKWHDEAAIRRWREVPQHRAAQKSGRERLFADYRLRVGELHATPPFDALKTVPFCALLEWEGDVLPMSLPPGAERFRSLLRENAWVAVSDLREVDAGFDAFERLLPRAGESRTAGTPAVSFCALHRDYGLRDRAEAPQA